MGTTRNGLLRSINGRVGPVVVANSDDDVSIVRILPKLSTKPPKQAQLNQREIFKAVMKFVKQNQEVMRIGYQSYKGAVKPLNAAASFILKNAVTGVYPNYKIDYSAVQTSEDSGAIGGVAESTMVPVAGGKVTITWDPTQSYSGTKELLRNLDDAVIMLLNETSGYAGSRTGLATRGSGTATVRIPISHPGDKVHAWLFFASVDGKVTPSQYMGPIVALE